MTPRVRLQQQLLSTEYSRNDLSVILWRPNHEVMILWFGRRYEIAQQAFLKENGGFY